MLLPPPGERATPPLKFTAVSARSGFEPSTRATASPTGKTPVCAGTPPTTLVTTLLKYSWLSPGARNPVLAAPRSASRFQGWYRSASFPVTRAPTSLYVSNLPARLTRSFCDSSVSASVYTAKLVRWWSEGSDGVNPGKPCEPSTAGPPNCVVSPPSTYDAGSP